jgi:transcriptional regulator with XRE-family HTH domain
MSSVLRFQNFVAACGRRAHHLRKGQGMTQGQLAQAAGTKLWRVQFLEQGRPDAEVSDVILTAIGAALGVPQQALLDDAVLDCSAFRDLFWAMGQLSPAAQQAVRDYIALLWKREGKHRDLLGAGPW